MAEYAIFLFADERVIKSDLDGHEREQHDEHAEELQEENFVIAAFALEPYETSTSIRANGITDGPFTESREVILGFYVIEAVDLDAALATASRNPIIKQGGGVEVRPVESFMVRPVLDH